MTTPIAQNPDISLAPAPLAPVGQAAAADSSPRPEMEQHPGGLAKSVAHWVHRHPEAHKHGAGVLMYQVVRSAIASIPYGFSMAGTLAAFTGMERFGAQLSKNASSSVAKSFGRNLKGFATFGPAKAAALVATSFTLYRGTSKLSKWMTEYLFNPKDSEQRTAEKVSDIVPEGVRKVKEIFPAEAASTPVAAIILGFIVSAFQKPSAEALKVEINGVKRSIDWTRDSFKTIEGLGNKLRVMKSAIIHPNAKFIPQAVINTFGYSLFFEMGDRLFKDAQIRRGVWPGEHNSIKALKAGPDEFNQEMKARDTEKQKKYTDSALEPVKEKSHYSFFTSEPGVGRFLFRRVLPTAIGITAYTAAKMRWASMLGNDFKYAEGKMAPQFFEKARNEGLATVLFFLIPIVSEPWEKMYDSFFAKKDRVANAREHPEMFVKTLDAHQQQKYGELLDRVSAKEHASGRAA